MVAGRTREACDAALEPVRAAGSDGVAVAADATNEADCDRMVQEALDRFGRLDIVVNAVGGGAGGAPSRPRNTRATPWTGSWSSTSAASSSRRRPPRGR